MEGRKGGFNPVDQGTDDKRTGSHACQIEINGDNLFPFFLRPEIPHISYRMNRFCSHPRFPLETFLFLGLKGKFFRVNNINLD
jgi:hypothetical protein